MDALELNMNVAGRMLRRTKSFGTPRSGKGYDVFSPRSIFSPRSDTETVSAENITVGSSIWIEDDELAWIDAEVSEVLEEEVKAITNKGKMLYIPFYALYPRDTDVASGVEDMTRLSYLSEPGVLYNLAKRYEQKNIYTYSGKILIAVNPFSKLPKLYNLQTMGQYRGATFGQLSPHVFAVADSAYRAMINNKHNQSILVSGESGAGKTETTKLIMQYLAFVGGRAAADNRTVEQQVLQSNPLLEAFGNARTVRNDNSSRFGKFVEIQFDKTGRISGAAIRTYLLEKCRVVQITKSERNFHCFYQLCASPEAVKKYKLGEPKTLNYLNHSDIYELCGISDAEEYVNTLRAMDIVGIGFDEQEAIFRTLAGILHLGNIEFSSGKEHDSSTPKDRVSQFHLQSAADLLRCDPKSLEDTLCTHLIAAPEGMIIKYLDPAAAATNRDALAKTIYSRLFEWLVTKINTSIGQDPHSKTQIGVLDIYGFECLDTNSFEQFCINLANEKLQQHFNMHVFKMEQDNYNKEHINWSHIDFIDNQDVLDLLEQKYSGIIALLDDCCKFPKSTGKTLAAKLYQAFKDHPRFKMHSQGLSEFTIYHYAGEVTYQMDRFLEKNKDYIVVKHHNLMSSSKCFFIAKLFPPNTLECSGSSFKFSSVSSQFKQQLQALMDTLSSTDPHFIRCVKPNLDNEPWKFENLSVLHQLRCGGVIEAIRISCAGYPTRCMYQKFLDRFGFLAPEAINGWPDVKTATEKLLQRLNIQNYQLGKTMVFLRAAQMIELDSQRTGILNSAARSIQCRLRAFLAHKFFLQIRKASMCVQAFSRGCLARHLYDFKRKEKAAIIIQKYLRRHLQRMEYVQLSLAAISIQTGIRCFLICSLFSWKKHVAAAVVIQKQWRMQKILSEFINLRSALITLQCKWRQQVAKKKLQKLEAADRQRNCLQEAKNKLQRRCEEVTQQLGIENKESVAADEFEKMEVMKLHTALHEMQEQLNRAALNLSKEQEKTKALKVLLETVMWEKHPLQSNMKRISDLKKENEYLKASTDSLQRRAEKLKMEMMKSRTMYDEWQKKKLAANFSSEHSYKSSERQ